MCAKDDKKTPTLMVRPPNIIAGRSPILDCNTVDEKGMAKDMKNMVTLIDLYNSENYYFTLFITNSLLFIPPYLYSKSFASNFYSSHNLGSIPNQLQVLHISFELLTGFCYCFCLQTAVGLVDNIWYFH